MTQVKSKYWLCIGMFSAIKHYLSQTDIEVDLANIHLKNKCLLPTQCSFTLSKIPTYFMNVEIKTVWEAFDLYRFIYNIK